MGPASAARAGASGLLLVAMSWAVPGVCEVQVAFTPGSFGVRAGTEFDVNIVVTEEGSSFNAFNLVVGFDPAALTPITMSPLVDQVGVAMLETCPTIFNDFRIGPASDTINCAMLCGGASINGPGQVYQLRFLASDTPQVAELTIEAAKFFNGGIQVGPTMVSNATVHIAAPPLDVDDAPSALGLMVRAAPNPMRQGTTLSWYTPRAGPVTLKIIDTQGRMMRRLSLEGAEAGRGAVWWDGKSETGAPVSAGVYRVVLSQGQERAQRTVAVVR
jgi:hypothetical protein